MMLGEVCNFAALFIPLSLFPKFTLAPLRPYTFTPLRLCAFLLSLHPENLKCNGKQHDS
jgi:hypothetical protein